MVEGRFGVTEGLFGAILKLSFLFSFVFSGTIELSFDRTDGAASNGSPLELFSASWKELNV
jgi:hypothetical protein